MIRDRKSNTPTREILPDKIFLHFSLVQLTKYINIIFSLFSHRRKVFQLLTVFRIFNIFSCIRHHRLIKSTVKSFVISLKGSSGETKAYRAKEKITHPLDGT